MRDFYEGVKWWPKGKVSEGFDGLGLKRSESKVSALVAGVREPWGCFEWLRGKGGG